MTSREDILGSIIPPPPDKSTLCRRIRKTRRRKISPFFVHSALMSRELTEKIAFPSRFSSTGSLLSFSPANFVVFLISVFAAEPVDPRLFRRKIRKDPLSPRKAAAFRKRPKTLSFCGSFPFFDKSDAVNPNQAEVETRTFWWYNQQARRKRGLPRVRFRIGSRIGSRIGYRTANTGGGNIASASLRGGKITPGSVKKIYFCCKIVPSEL